MKCKQAKALIALWVGNDLENNSVGKLERHVTVCPCCRIFWKKIQQTQRVLQQIDDNPLEPAPSESCSIWQELSHKIDCNVEQYQRERFNGWVPALAVVSACMLLLFCSHSLSHVPVSTEPTFDVHRGFSEVTFPNTTPVHFSDIPSHSHHSLSYEDLYSPPNYQKTPSIEEFKRTVETSPQGSK